MHTLREDEVFVLLECEHKRLAHVASSTFDFPDDQVWCSECKQLVHLDKDVRRMLKVMHLRDAAKKAADWLRQFSIDNMDTRNVDAAIEANALANDLDNTREQV